MKWLHDIRKKHEEEYIRQHPEYPCSQQLDGLRKELDIDYRGLHRFIIGIIITAIISILFFPNGPAYIIGIICSMLVLFFGGVVVAAKIARPHIKNAISAFNKGKFINISALIEIETSDERSDIHYVIVEGLNKEKWRFFFSPSGWRPTEGVLQVKAYFLDNVQWPVLLIGEAGIMYPTSKPKNLVV